MIKQGEIVEVPFRFPNGDVLFHPALVISSFIDDNLGNFFYAILISSKNINPSYTIEIKPGMLTKEMSKQSFFVTHLVDKFTESDISHHQQRVFVKPEFINFILEKSITNIFGLSDVELDG